MIFVETKIAMEADIKIRKEDQFNSIYLYAAFEPRFSIFNKRLMKNINDLTDKEWRNIEILFTFPLIQEEFYIESKRYDYISDALYNLFDKEEMDCYTMNNKNKYVHLRQSNVWFLKFNDFIRYIQL